MSVVTPSDNVHTCPCVCVPASLYLRPMRHIHTGTCVCITNVCVPAGSHVLSVSVSSRANVLA
jgi:hypothetical protein